MRMIKWENGTVLTPTRPNFLSKEVTLRIKTVDQMCEAITVLRVRGAPLLGAAAAFGIALAAYHSKATNKKRLLEELQEAASAIKAKTYCS